MEFYSKQLFHIYNQGNNRRQIFFTEEHYKYFLWKMRAHLLPFGDLVAFCLMPNHFHWLFFVKEVEVSKKVLTEHLNKIESLRRIKKYGTKAQALHPAKSTIHSKTRIVSLNNSIGSILKSYTKAINKEKNWSGSLFRKTSKAKDGWIDELITLKKSSGKIDARFLKGNDYAYQCFCYIHDNPKQARLVANPIDWEYSSAKDYAGLRNGNLCNLEMGRNLKKFIF